jgi:hypothetical protein
MITISNFDIYTEMEKVCPNQGNLRSLTEEELTARVSSVNQASIINRAHPSPKSEVGYEAEVLTEEQDHPSGYF